MKDIHTHQLWSKWIRWVMFLFIISAWVTKTANATSTVCAAVQLQINQQLTFERQGFTGTMTITNGLTTSAITNIQVTLQFTDINGNTVNATTDPNAVGQSASPTPTPNPNTTTYLFFYEPVNGQGIPNSIPAGQAATLGWLIIPSAGAGGNSPNGVEYNVGATLSYTVAGQQQTVPVTPASIFVDPQPQLTLDYFLPTQVYGTDPTSSTVTPPIPFNLGLLVHNTGFGSASNFQINSAQPQITNNPQGLAVQFALLGTSINDAPVSPSLTVNFGTLQPRQAAVANWIMTSTLSGQLSFTVNINHSDTLGGSVTTLIPAANSHGLIQNVLVDLPGRDNIRDFLAQDGNLYNVYESQGTVTSVGNESSVASLNGITNQTFKLSLPGNQGFIYAQVSDPFNGTQSILSATRADGKVMNLDNVWLSRTFSSVTEKWTYYLNLFDDNNYNGTAYNIAFGNAPTAPVFGPLADQLLTAGSSFTLPVTAADADGTTPILSSGPLPMGATVTSSSGGLVIFSWAPKSVQAGTYPITFNAQNGTFTTSKTINLTVGGGSKYNTWKDKYFPGITDPAIIGDSANPAGDGISNLLKYALNLDPTKAESNTGIVIGTTQVGEQKYLTLTYTVRTDDPTIQIQAIGSNFPSAATAAWQVQTAQVTPVDQTGVPSNMAKVTIQDSQPISNSPQRFMKLLVTNLGNGN